MSKKGDKSKTHPGDMDYTTKKGDEDFHERLAGKKEEKRTRRPYILTKKHEVKTRKKKDRKNHGAERKARPLGTRKHPSDNERKKMNLTLRARRIQMGVVPRTFSGEDGAGI